MSLDRGDLVAPAENALGRELLTLLQLGQLHGLLFRLVAQPTHALGDLAVLVGDAVEELGSLQQVVPHRMKIEQWTQELARVLPPSEYPIEDVPMTDPIFRSQFTVTKVPQITNIGFWRRSGGRETSERGDESRDVHFRVIRDHRGRVMVVMTHNTDVGDSWEREGEDPEFFLQFSPDGYALGINVLLHAMTH